MIKKLHLITPKFKLSFLLYAFCLLVTLTTIAQNSGSPSINYKFNFATAATNTPADFIEDTGVAYGPKTNGLTYGWVLATNNNPIDVSNNGRNRTANPDADFIRETLIHMHYLGSQPATNWEILVPNGNYQVAIQAGDTNTEGLNLTHHLIKVENVTIVDHRPNMSSGTRTNTAQVTVTDGVLTVDGADGFNAKINAITIQSTDGFSTPVIVGSVPTDGATNVATTTNISANFIGFTNFINGGTTGINNSTISTSTVKLFEVNGNSATPVNISVNGTGGGDAINISLETARLKANTRYLYSINGVEDLTGKTFLPFSAAFETGADTDPPGTSDLDDVTFTNAGTVANGRYTTLTFGPDGKLYGLTLFGAIDRYNVNENGSLSNKQTLTTLRNTFGNIMSIGLAFAPNATATNLEAYVTHSTGNGQAYGGRLSKLSGANLEIEQTILTNLPRSIKDHLSLSLTFDPNNPNVIYFNQGSNSAAGEPDAAWGFREERLLTAANLRLDLDKLPNILPLDVRCSEDQNIINSANTNSPTMSDGSYNPYYVNAPLTLFATGIRNAYDLLWHSNGQLYIPTNGTAGNSNSPASVLGTRRPDGSFYNGQDVPALFGNEVQRDFLFRVDPNAPNGYYGHPNPLRGEYVMSRGPVDERDYPSDIEPDANYQGIAFDFEFNKSPNGIIEYRFPGPLQGAMIVCRYSGGSDLIALVPDGPNGDISTSKIGIPGFSGLFNPLDLIEDTRNGNIYVSDLGQEVILLLKPGNETETNNDISLSFSNPANGTNIQVGESLNVEVEVSVGTSTIANIDLFLNDEFVRRERLAPYQWGLPEQNDSLLENLAAGSYILRAVATTSNEDTAETSITVTVQDDSNEFSISFSSPEDGDVYAIGQELDVEVFTSNNSLVSNIDLFLNDEFVRRERLAPYQWGLTTQNDPLLENLAAGSYTLRAVATTSNEDTAETSITVTVQDNSNEFSISFSSPEDGDVYAIGQELDVEVFTSNNSLVSNIDLFLNDEFVRRERFAPYQWGLTTQNDPLLENLAAGSYTLRAMATTLNGDIAEKQITVTVQNSSGNELSVTNINVYPNPTRGEFSVAISNIPDVKDIQVSLFSMAGEKFLQQTFKKSKESLLNIDISGLPNGIYMLMVSTGSQKREIIKVVLKD